MSSISLKSWNCKVGEKWRLWGLASMSRANNQWRSGSLRVFRLHGELDKTLESRRGVVRPRVDKEHLAASNSRCKSICQNMQGEMGRGIVIPFLGFTLRDVRKWGTHPPSTSSFPRHRCEFSDRGRRGSTWTWGKVCSLSRGSISLVVAPSRQTGSRN